VQLTMWAVEHRTEPMFRDTWNRWLEEGLAAVSTMES
jgi:hypothetical protein